MNDLDHIKYAGDALSAAAWVTALTGAVTGFIGVFAAIASLIWFCIRIYETKTFQGWLKRKQAK